MSAARAQLASARATLATSRATYLSVVGENPGKLEPEPSLAKLLPGDIDKALDMAEQNNPHLREADYAEQASAAKVAAAKAQTRPSVSLQATLGYYGALDRDPILFWPLSGGHALHRLQPRPDCQRYGQLPAFLRRLLFLPDPPGG